MSKTTRRTFMTTTGAGLTLGLARSSQSPSSAASTPEGYRQADGFTTPPLERVRIAFVGVGLQGGSHVRNFLRIEGVDIKAICDIDEARAKEVAGWVAEEGRPTPALYTNSELAWRRINERDDIDLVFNSTPWRWHVPVCVEAMQSGKHTAVEVPAAYTIEDCWRLVETAERTERHCVMMENCCYDRREMMILRMVREGALGELLHAEAAYIHDLRDIKFSDENEGLWRLRHSELRNGNLYPTHGLGPVAQCLDINRGDQFDYLVSMSTPQRGLTRYAKARFGEDDPRSQAQYVLGDMNTSLIKTKLGRTILLQHDTTTPRPYSRLNLVQGTAGVVSGYPNRVFVESEAEGHRWSSFEEYLERYDHPLWQKREEDARGAGHGGMDYLEDLRLITSLRTGTPMDMDVYDAAAWSVVCELTEQSVASGSQPVPFPDFTRGHWREREPLGIVDA